MHADIAIEIWALTIVIPWCYPIPLRLSSDVYTFGNNFENFVKRSLRSCCISERRYTPSDAFWRVYKYAFCMIIAIRSLLLSDLYIAHVFFLTSSLHIVKHFLHFRFSSTFFALLIWWRFLLTRRASQLNYGPQK